jgi:hypothetical protein
MDTYTAIISLPDYLPTDEIKVWFNKLLNESGSWEKEKVIDCLFELSDRQWHTYELLDETVKSRITSWIESNWEGNLDFIESIAGIVGMLGLENIYLKIKSLLSDPIGSDLKRGIEKIIAEFGDSVADPYISLK